MNLCLHVCMCKIETKMSMNSRKSSGRPSYYYRLLRRSRLQRQRSRSRSRNRPLSRGNSNNGSLSLTVQSHGCWCLQVASLPGTSTAGANVRTSTCWLRSVRRAWQEVGCSCRAAVTYGEGEGFKCKSSAGGVRCGCCSSQWF